MSLETLWHEFAHEHAIVPVLARRYRVSESTVRRRLDSYALPKYQPTPRSMVAVMDATKVGDTWVLAVRNPHASETVYADEIPIESTSSYQAAFQSLVADGFTIQAIVSDGRFVAVDWLFPGIPIQMCHYHQEQIVIRYLTLNPKLTAGIELLQLIRTLPNTDAMSFANAFRLWCGTHHIFLQEKTLDEHTGRWSWTHRRLRQARDSIAAHLPYLFTYQKYPALNIPNTTNSLDGKFGKAKTALAVHSGLTHKRQIKVLLSILFSRSEHHI